MAQSDRFFFWIGYRDAMEQLENDGQRGRFVRGMCDYAFDGTEPDFSDSKILSVMWAIVRDQVRESVEIGRRQSEYGKKGGRPRKDDEKRVPKRQPKRVPKSSPERVPERVPESEEKGRDQKGTELPPSGDAFRGVPSGEPEIDFDNLPPMAHERA